MRLPTRQEAIDSLKITARRTRDIAVSGLADNIWKNPALVRGAQVIKETLGKAEEFARKQPVILGVDEAQLNWGKVQDYMQSLAPQTQEEAIKQGSILIGGKAIDATLGSGAIKSIGKEVVGDVVEAAAPVVKKVASEVAEEAKGLLGKAKSAVTDLLSEARKYKTAEEFVGAQGEPLLHLTEKGNVESINKQGLRMTAPSEGSISEGISLTTKRTEANTIFGEGEVTAFISPSAKTITLKDALAKMGHAGETDKAIIKTLESEAPSWAAKNGYDILDMRDARGAVYRGMDEIRVLNPDVVKTKSQLTSLWEQAQKEGKRVLEQYIPQWVGEPGGEVALKLPNGIVRLDPKTVRIETAEGGGRLLTKDGWVKLSKETHGAVNSELQKLFASIK